MKRICFLTVLMFFALCSLSVSVATEQDSTDIPEEQKDSAVAPLPSWQETMRIYLEKFGSCTSESEIESVMASRAVDPERPMIALTFDDGPVAGVTDLILDVLEEYNVRATFFIMGCRLKKEPNAAILPRMLALGCEIGNHTYNHERLKNSSSKYQKKTVGRVNDHVFELTGFTPTSLRPPGGMTGNTVIKNAGELGMAIVLWSQSGDVRKSSPQAIADNIFTQSQDGRKLRSGDIVLLHDTKKYMVEAVKIMIPRLLEEGYQLVTVQELLSYSEIGYRAGYQYRSVEDYYTYE